MKIEKLKLTNLQNAEHFQFHTNVIRLIKETTPAAIKSEAEYAAYTKIFADEDEIMKRITMSAITMQIADADAERDQFFRSMVDYYNSSRGHFNDAVREAAARLFPVFSAFDDLPGEALANQSADTYNFIQELQTKHAEDCITTGLVQWLDELKKRNKAVDDLMYERYEETAARPGLVLRDVRLQVDAAYVTIADRVDALALIEGGAVYDTFIATLNAIIDRAKNTLAARRGRAKAKKEDEETDN